MWRDAICVLGVRCHEGACVLSAVLVASRVCDTRTEDAQRAHLPEALVELRKRTSSFALPKVPSAKFTNVKDVTRGQEKALARGASQQGNNCVEEEQAI